MRKNLHNQLVKKLHLLKNKEKNRFLHCVCLNANLKSSTRQYSLVLTKLQTLVYGRQAKSLTKKKVFITQIKTQCNLTWRSRSVYSFFTLSRITLRELAHCGLLKGVKKASW